MPFIVDGELWSRTETRSVIAASERADYGMIFAFPNLVALDEQTWGLPFIGQYEQHDWGARVPAPRPPDWRWATWKPHRLTALEAENEGRVTLVERTCAGAELRLNYQAAAEGGSVRVELVEPPRSHPDRLPPVHALDGFSLAEAEPLRGDEVSAVVRWAGRSDLSALAGRPVAVRLHLVRAKVFAAAW